MKLHLSAAGGRQVRLAIVRVAFRRPRRYRAASSSAGVLTILISTLLTGCGTNDGTMSMALDPGRYVLYRCSDLVARSKELAAREKTLLGLMDRANEGGGGSAVSLMTYRTDYETVLSDEKLVQHAAAEKKCDLVPTFNSDHTIR